MRHFFSPVERMLAFRYVRSRRAEGFISLIAWFSLAGITLGVATLIVVMSVMNGFRTELTEKILGFNSHVTVKPYSTSITENLYSHLQNDFKDTKFCFSPGINEIVEFENDLAEKFGIKSFMIDGSIKKPPLKNNLFEFQSFV